MIPFAGDSFTGVKALTFKLLLLPSELLLVLISILSWYPDQIHVSDEILLSLTLLVALAGSLRDMYTNL